MKLSGIGLAALGALGVAACSMDGEGSDPELTETRGAIIGPSTLGGRNEVVMLWA
jgi:hypothetical protein